MDQVSLSLSGSEPRFWKGLKFSTGTWSAFWHFLPRWAKARVRLVGLIQRFMILEVRKAIRWKGPDAKADFRSRLGEKALGVPSNQKEKTSNSTVFDNISPLVSDTKEPRAESQKSEESLGLGIFFRACPQGGNDTLWRRWAQSFGWGTGVKLAFGIVRALGERSHSYWFDWGYQLPWIGS